MFREMRRKGNALTKEETIEILRNNTNGTLAVIGDEDYPYAVPLSYVYQDEKIFFHCATQGHKLDAILKNNKVSFCVVAQDEIIPEDFNTLFISVIAFGTARVLEDDREKREALESILQKYSGDFMEEGRKYMEKAWNDCVAVEITIEHLSGKAGD